jgi:hypothetical protein
VGRLHSRPVHKDVGSDEGSDVVGCVGPVVLVGKSVIAGSDEGSIVVGCGIMVVLVGKSVVVGCGIVVVIVGKPVLIGMAMGVDDADDKEGKLVDNRRDGSKEPFVEVGGDIGDTVNGVDIAVGRNDVGRSVRSCWEGLDVLGFSV